MKKHFLLLCLLASAALVSCGERGGDDTQTGVRANSDVSPNGGTQDATSVPNAPSTPMPVTPTPPAPMPAPGAGTGTEPAPQAPTPAPGTSTSTGTGTGTEPAPQDPDATPPQSR